MAYKEKDTVIPQSTAERDIILAGKSAMADVHAKNLLKNRQVAARLIKLGIHGFHDLSYGEIEAGIAYSDGNVTTGKFRGSDTEDNVPGEGRTSHDVIFSLTNIRTDVTVDIDIEPQGKFNPGYPLIMRAVFKFSRIMSSQGDTVFSLQDSEYGKVRKVCSVWLCAGAPKKERNSVTEYTVAREVLYGSPTDNGKHDLMQVLMVVMSEETDTGNELLDYVNLLFSGTIPVDEKIRILRDKYEMKTDDEIKNEVGEMTELMMGFRDMYFSDGKEEGMKEGLKEGLKEGFMSGIINTAMNMIRMNFSNETIHKATNMSIAEIETLRESEIVKE